MAAVGNLVIWGKWIKLMRQSHTTKKTFPFSIFFCTRITNGCVVFQSVHCQLIYTLIIILSYLVCLLLIYAEVTMTNKQCFCCSDLLHILGNRNKRSVLHFSGALISVWEMVEKGLPLHERLQGRIPKHIEWMLAKLILSCQGYGMFFLVSS